MAARNTEPGGAATRTFRLSGDVSGKLSELLELLNITSAKYLDPLVRGQIEQDHDSNIVAIKAMRRARLANASRSSLRTEKE